MKDNPFALRCILAVGTILFAWIIAIYFRFRRDESITPRRVGCLICKAPLHDAAHTMICDNCCNLSNRTR